MIFLLIKFLLISLISSFRIFEPSLINKFNIDSHSPNISDDNPYLTYYQKLDHFNTSDQNTFAQRYLLNEDYYDDSHMLIFFLNGEAQLMPSRAKNGFQVGLDHFTY